MNTRDAPEYFSYLLRLWRENGEDGMCWRVSLENAETGERVGFADLDELFDYLNQQTKSSQAEKGAPNDDGNPFNI
jgi:hypothetical protein